MSVIDTVSTFEDMLDYITAMTDGGARSKDLRMHKEVIIGSYRDLSMAAEWDYYMGEGRVDLVALYNTGSVAYDHTGDSDYERKLTLTGTGAAWPSWAKFGRVRIDDAVYTVESRVSDSIITLDSNSNPGADVAASTSYELFRSVYPLPDDLWRLYDVGVEKSFWVTYYLSPSAWQQRERFLKSSGQTWAWTLMKDPDSDGKWALWVDPSPDTAEPLMFIYRRRPRILRWAGTETEARTYTFSGSDDASTLTTSTALPSSMVGSIIRLSSNSKHPTGLGGTNPYNEQHKITKIDGTTVTISGTLGQTYAASSKFTVSDIIDMSDTMIEALKAQIEYRFSRFANDQRGIVTSRQVADFELRRALEAEQRYASRHGGFSRYDYLFRHTSSAISTGSG